MTKATITGNAYGFTKEDGKLIHSGKLTVNDPDPGENHTIAVTNALTAGGYGTWSVDANGNWSYKLDNSNPAVQALGVGDKLTDSFVVTSVDGSASKTVNITINGTNDLASMSGQTTGSVLEDVDPVATGSFTINDRDQGENQATVVSGAASNNGYGTWSVDAGGQWIFTLDNANATVQGLGAGEKLSDSFTVTSADGTASKTVTVTITGTNDLATIDGTDDGDVTEDGTLTASGKLTVEDADSGEAQATVVSNAAAAYGTWSVAANGEWTYTLDNANPAVQALQSGETLSDTFTVTSQDGTASKDVTITIHGTDDSTSISGDTTGSVQEDVTFAASGTLTVTDSNPAEEGTQAASANAAYGSWSVDTEGHWTYTLDNNNAAVQALGAGKQLTDSFDVTSTDGSTTQTVTITIDGTNDAAAFTFSSYAKAVKEEGAQTTSGTVTLIDPDAGESHTTVVTNAAASYGSWSVDDDGHWSYQLNNGDASVQALGAGDSLKDSFTITSQDGSASKVITVTINGTNDVASITGTSAGSVTEDSGALVTGTLHVNDKDNGQDHTKAVASGAATYGTWSVDGDGHWSYDLDDTKAAVDALAPGQTLTDNFTVQSIDGSRSKVVTVTINGANDAPDAQAGSFSGDEDAKITGQLVATDPDNGDTQTFSLASGGDAAHGSVVVNADGTFEYTPIGDYNGPDSFTYQVVDKYGAIDTATVSLTIDPVNDDPDTPTDTDASANAIYAGATAGTPVGITVHATDIDGDTPTYSLNDDAGGRFEIDANTGVITVATGAVIGEGAYNVTAVADDGHGGTSEQTFSINAGPLVVDQSGAGGAFTTIQAAVDYAANLNGPVRIVVNTGVYHEQVQVNGHDLDGLTIEAASGADVNVLPPPTPWESTANSPTSGRDYDGLITVDGADNVTLRGFTVDGQELGDSAHLAGANNPSMAGIVYVNTTGGVIDGMIVTGIREGDSGFGNQRNIGIAVLNDNPGSTNTPNETDALGLNTIEITGTTVENFQKTGIQVSYADVNIHDNTVTGIGSTTWTAQNGIQVSGSTGSIADNQVSDIGYAGSDWAASDILTFENRDLSIDNNTVTATPGDSTIGIAAEDSVGTTITNNTIDGADYPIDVEDYPSDWGWPDPLGGGTYDLGSNAILNTTAGAYFQADPASTEAFDVTGTANGDTIITGAAADTIDGGAGNDDIDGGKGADAMHGGDGNDTFAVDDAGDTVTEDAGEGTGDTVNSSVDFTLGDNVENLNLVEGKASQTIDFEGYALGPITDGENGWKNGDATIVQGVTNVGGSHGNVFVITNDPPSGNYAGPFTPALSVEVGEAGAGGDTDRMTYSLDFKPVNSLADGSRVEIDFANASGTDRENFMVLEYVDGGIRLAVNEPTKDGDWAVNDFTFETGNRTLIDGLDPSQWHNIQLTLVTNDGPDNDVIQVYVDGELVGTTTTFENYRDFQAPGGGEAAHDANAAANLIDRLIFRVGDAGSPGAVDGPGGDRQGFMIDNISTSAGAPIIGIGNGEANIINGNSADNLLDGKAGDDTLNGGIGFDTLTGGEGNDAIDGGAGSDAAVFSGKFADYDIAVDSINGLIKVEDTKAGVDGDDGKDTLSSVEGLEFSDTTVLIVDQTGQFGNFTTIQAAVDAANGIPAGQHVTVLVMAGDYAENVVIGRSDLALVSQAGKDDTTITGTAASGELGTIQLAPGADNVTIGGIDHGFEIVGFDSTPGLEVGAIYLQGNHNGVVIQGNNVVANGDSGLTGEFAAANTNMLIDSNEFSGQTFTGPQPGGIGFSGQFTDPNVPRQLVVLGNGGGAGESASHHITFSNNLVSGTTGGVSSVDNMTPQGNTLVTIDASHSVIDGNTFTGDTGGTGYALRARRDDTEITDNTLDEATGGSSTGILVQNSTEPASSFTGNHYAGGGGAANIISMTPGADTLDGAGGNDKLAGSAGDDVINGDAGDDVLDGGAGNDTMNGGAGNDTYKVDSADDVVSEVGGSGTDLVQSSASFTLATDVENLTLIGGGNIDGTGNGDANAIIGNTGDNTLTGGGGSDDIDGGAGIDTAAYSGNFADYTFDATTTPGSLIVNGGTDGGDTVVNVEKLQFADQTVLVVGAGGFATIQSAIDAASAGDTILVMEGTYAENVNVNESVTIVGVGDVVIEGSFRTDNPSIPSGTTVGDWLESATAYNGNSGSGVTINADDVTLQNLTITTFLTGIKLNANDGLTLNDVNVDDSVRAIYKESGPADVTNFEMNGGVLSNSYQGIVINAANPGAVPPEVLGSGSFDNVTIQGTSFQHLTEKGIYAEQLSNALIQGVVMNDVGEYGRGPAFGGNGTFGNGIDINLKYDSFSNITIKDAVLTDVGHSYGNDAVPDATGAAIAVKARDDAPSYSSPAASLTGVLIEGGSIDGTSTGIRIGEPLKNNGGPSGVIVDGVDITNATSGEYDNRTQSTLDVTLSNTDHIVDASAIATGSIVFHGTEDADQITGGGGNDTLNGNGGDDTLAYNVGGGNDVVDGGDDTDTLVVNHGGAAPMTFDVTASGADPVHIAITGGKTVDASNVEELTFNLGSGGDTVNIGDLDGTSVLPSTITVNGGDGADTVDADAVSAGNPVGVVFDGGKGDDTFTSGAGDDTFTGGADHDVAVYSGALGDLSFQFNGTGPSQTLTVTSTAGDGADTLSGVERIDVGAAHVLIVGAGGYATIQAAIDAASDGDTILVGPGTYNENVNVDKSVTIQGSGDDTVIQGDFRSDNSIPGGTTVAEWLETAPSYTGAAGSGVTIAADNVTLQGLKITGFLHGIELGSNDGLTVSGVDISESVVGIRKGTAAVVTGFDLEGGSITDSYHGIAIYAASNGAGDFSGVTINGTHFENLTEKGIYAEQLSDAVIDGVTMENVGEFGRGPAFGASQVGQFGSGIDINLKYENYSNIEIKNFDLQNTGHSFGNDASADNTGGAILVKARDDAPSYASPGAHLTGVSIHDGTIDGTGVGIRTGEPAKGNAEPALTINNVEISNADIAQYDNQTHSVTDVTLTAGDDTAVAAAGSIGAFHFDAGDGQDDVTGGGGDDRLTGGKGDDTLTGGGGGDTAVFSGNMADYTITWDGQTATVHDNVGTDGEDTIVGVGVLQFLDHKAILVGQSPDADFTTIQSGVDAANSGDVVLVGEGIFAENVLVNGKAITIDGVGRGGTNTELDGTITVSGTVNGDVRIADMIVDATGQQVGVNVTASSAAFAGSFTLDNVLVENAQTNGLAYIRQGNGSTPTLTDTLGEITIENSEFNHNATVNSGGGGRGDILIFGYNQDLTVDNVSIHDAGVGAQKAIQLRGLQSPSDVTNVGPFQTGGNVTLNGIAVSGNYLQDAIAIYRYADFNAFGATNVSLAVAAPWGLINLDEVGSTAGIDLQGIGGSNSAPGGLFAHVHDLPTDDTIFGTDGHDIFEASGGKDTFHGNGGDDTFLINDPANHPAGEAIDGGGDIDTILFTDTTDGHLLTLQNVTNIEHVTVANALGATTGTQKLDVDASSLTADVTLTGNDGDNKLTGGSGNDHLVGNGGNDTLDGGAGNDTLEGGQGNDYYFVDSGGDVVTESASQGTDTVESSVSSYTLTSEVENLVLSMTAGDIDGTGNGGANTITGNDGANEIDGGGGGDTLIGGKGDDHLLGNLGIDKLYGGEGNDHLEGGSGADTLNGGADNDTLSGGAGPDTFQFDSFMDGQDTIEDFDGENDNLSFNASLDIDNNGVIDDLYAAIASIDDATAGGDVVVHFKDGGSITFAGIGTGSTTDIAQLVADPSQIQTHS